VVVNLGVNAIQAMPQGGKLHIKTQAHHDHISIMMEDTGVGMSPEVLKQIFLPFFTTKDVGEGTGLGLSVVHGIVSSHGGSIKVDSTPGIGTTFEIQLPLDGTIEWEDK
jgi:signal transduction histidine kinase